MKKLFAISPLIGTLITLFLMKIVWEKNPNGDIHTNGVIQWETVLPVLFSSWILTTLATAAFFFAAYLFYRLIYHIYLRVSDDDGK